MNCSTYKYKGKKGPSWERPDHCRLWRFILSGRRRPPPNKKILSPKINCYLSREQQPPPLPLLPSVTRWLDHSDNIWPFITMNFCPITNQVAKVGSQFCQILIKPSKNCQRLKFFTKVAKFHQIWSHWLPLNLLKLTTAIIGYLIDSIRSWHEWSIRAITDHAIL